ncbi:MAG: OsmC family protein [Acidobacteriota bacterium]
MTGTLGGALEARHVDASHGRLVGEVQAEVESEDGVLIMRRIHVHYRLQASEDQRAVIERVHGFHARFCPVYRSIEAAIEITTDFEIVSEKP